MFGNTDVITMATIKAFSDLEQSKKLAEILPLESADMFYSAGNETQPTFRLHSYGHIISDKDVCAWSLAALLSIIPQEIFNGEYIINITEGLNNRWMLTYDNYEIGNHPFYGLSTGADNLVDVCYEFILKLHELKML